MTFPGSLQITVLTGYFSAGVAPATGRLSLVATSRLMIDSTDEIMIPNPPIQIVLGTTASTWTDGQLVPVAGGGKAGWFSQPVISTDTPDIGPAGWAYDITVDIDGWERPFWNRYLIPYNSGTIDFSDLTPLA